MQVGKNAIFALFTVSRGTFRWRLRTLNVFWKGPIGVRWIVMGSFMIYYCLLSSRLAVRSMKFCACCFRWVSIRWHGNVGYENHFNWNSFTIIWPDLTIKFLSIIFNPIVYNIYRVFDLHIYFKWRFMRPNEILFLLPFSMYRILNFSNWSIFKHKWHFQNSRNK